MAFLDFIKNRDGQRSAGEQSSQQQQPETAKQMYARQATEEQGTPRFSELVQPRQQERLAEAQALYNKGTQEPPAPALPPAPTPAGGAANPQPMQQPMMGQETVAPDMSPTSAQASARSQDVEGPSTSAPAPAKSQQQTMARLAPSWER